MKHGLSGSTIKSWFQYRCERKTRYEMMTPDELAAVPVGSDQREKSWAVLGIDYENRVVGKLARGRRVHLKRSHEDGLSDAITNAFLKGEGDRDHAAQVNLRPKGRPPFLAGAENVVLRRTFADLVRREDVADGIEFTVIDIKATRAARAFHKTQVAYYALLLRQILKERGMSGRVSSFGEIWRIPDDGNAEGEDHQVERFVLAPYLRVVEEFVSHNLPAIAGKEVSSQRDATFFHIYFKCEQCSYLAHCMRQVALERPPEQRDVSAVPGLSHESKRTLVANNVRTVAMLARQGRGLGQVDGAGWALSRRVDQLIARAKAQVDDAIAPGIEEQSFLMPPRSDVALYLIADYDPVDDGLVTLGYLRVESGAAQGEVVVLDTPSRAAEADALVRIFGQVIAHLEAVDRHNANLDDGDPAALHAHLYLYEPTEAFSLQNAVKRHLDDSRIRGGLLNMVRLFPPEDLVPEPEFKGMNHLPATAVRSVVEQLFALPALVSYDLRQVSQSLARAGCIDQPYTPDAAFQRPFSALLSLEVSRQLREGKAGHPSVNMIRDDAMARLQATRAIVEWLQAEHGRRAAAGGRPMLRLAKKPFRLQASFDPIDAGDLDILKALELLENRAGMLATLIRLAKPSNTRRDAGNAMGPLRLLEIYRNARSRVFVFRRPSLARDVELTGAGLGLVLSDGSPEMLLDPRRWPDLSVTLLDPRAGDDPDIVRVSMWENVFQRATMQQLARDLAKDDWWLDQTFVDFNSDKAARYLAYLAAGATA